MLFTCAQKLSVTIAANQAIPRVLQHARLLAGQDVISHRETANLVRR